jgi:hypothetical protein
MRLAFAAVSALSLVAACRRASSRREVTDLAIADLAVDLAKPVCDDPDPPDGGICPVRITGQVVDEGGQGIDQLQVSVCAGLCFFGTTLADGTFAVVPDAHIVVSQYALLLHGRPGHVSYYTPLPPTSGAASVFPQPLPLAALPLQGPIIAGDGSAQDLTSGDVTLHIGAGTTVLFNVEDFGVAHGHDFRVVRAVVPARLPFVDGAPPPDLLYALAPFETGFKQKVGLALANVSGWAAGSAVEIRSMVGLVNDAPPAGPLVHAASAHVSADGASIATDAGEGLTELTWIAVYKT